MAQRTIHYLFGETLSNQIKLKDKNRFLLGSIMPDTYANADDRDLTHYKIKKENQAYFFTESMVDKFIDKYIPSGLEELRRIQSEEFTLCVLDYAWLRNR